MSIAPTAIWTCAHLNVVLCLVLEEETTIGCFRTNLEMIYSWILFLRKYFLNWGLSKCWGLFFKDVYTCRQACSRARSTTTQIQKESDQNFRTPVSVKVLFGQMFMWLPLEYFCLAATPIAWWGANIQSLFKLLFNQPTSFVII